MFFLGCENNKSDANKNNTTSSSASSNVEQGNNPNTPQCPENQQIVNGQCVCIEGYKLNEQGSCTEEIKLAKPHVQELEINMTDDIWYIHYDPATDINGIPVPSAVIWTAHIKLQNPGSTTHECDEYFTQQINCGEGTVYTGNINIPNGVFCLRSIACADGYQKSDMRVYQISIGNSSLEGDF
ncbi:MAG: hypothetical protein NTY22_09520, partial [Proteobacteria bacterium]|nr:hypothetical protein [Pseudomonadota bacterium]